jgi:hypothetical protein
MTSLVNGTARRNIAATTISPFRLMTPALSATDDLREALSKRAGTIEPRFNGHLAALIDVSKLSTEAYGCETFAERHAALEARRYDLLLCLPLHIAAQSVFAVTYPIARLRREGWQQ